MPVTPLWTSLRYRIEHQAFRVAALLFGSMELERASAVSGFLWRHVAPFTSRHRRALGHLRDAFPEWSEPQCETVARAMWENLGRTFAEAFHLRSLAASDRVSFENKDVLDRWAASEHGRVACAGHLGNWELAILGIMQAGAKPWSIYRALKNPLVDADVLSMRSFLYTGGLLPKGTNLTRQFLRLVRDGGTIGFLADQRDNTGVTVPLFGKPAPSTAFPALLSRATGAPILMVRMKRLPGVRFVQSFELLDVPQSEDRQADIAQATAQIQATFERYIRDAPEQWMWAHKRWS